MKDYHNTTRDIARELARKYSTMTHDELDILESIIVPKKYAKGETILREGETCEDISYIDRGLIRQFYFKNDKGMIYCLPKRRLEQVALHNVNIQILYRKILEESLIISQIHADLVRFESAQSRYQKLCKLKPQVVLRAPLVYIASYLQMTPETLSRVRAQKGDG